MSTVVEIIPNVVRLDEGGVLKVGDSRVSLDSVVYVFNEGMDAREIQREYDSLSLAQVHAALAYYLHNKKKVDSYLAKREIKREKIKREIQAEFPPRVTREMLLARKNGTDPDWKK